MSCVCVVCSHVVGYGTASTCSTPLLFRADILMYFSLHLCFDIRSLRSRPSSLFPYSRYTLLTVVAQTTIQDAQRLEAMIAPLEEAAAEERKRRGSRGGAATGVRTLDLARDRARRVSVVDSIMSHVSAAVVHVGSYCILRILLIFTVTCSRSCTRARPALPLPYSSTTPQQPHVTPLRSTMHSPRLCFTHIDNTYTYQLVHSTISGKLGFEHLLIAHSCRLFVHPRTLRLIKQVNIDEIRLGPMGIAEGGGDMDVFRDHGSGERGKDGGEGGSGGTNRHSGGGGGGSGSGGSADDAEFFTTVAKSAFAFFDSDGNGYIDADEVREVMVAFKQDLNDSEVSELMAKYVDEGGEEGEKGGEGDGEWETGGREREKACVCGRVCVHVRKRVNLYVCIVCIGVFALSAAMLCAMLRAMLLHILIQKRTCLHPFLCQVRFGW